MLHELDDTTTELRAQRTATGASVSLARTLRTTLLRVRADAAPTAVSDGATTLTRHADRAAFDAAATGAFYETATASIWIKVAALATPRTITTTAP